MMNVDDNTENFLTVEEIANEICMGFINRDIADSVSVDDKFDYHGDILESVFEILDIDLTYDDLFNEVKAHHTIKDVAEMVYDKLPEDDDECEEECDDEVEDDENDQSCNTVLEENMNKINNNFDGMIATLKDNGFSFYKSYQHRTQVGLLSKKITEIEEKYWCETNGFVTIHINLYYFDEKFLPHIPTKARYSFEIELKHEKHGQWYHLNSYGFQLDKFSIELVNRESARLIAAWKAISDFE